MSIKYGWQVILDDDDWDQEATIESLLNTEEAPQQAHSQLFAWGLTMVFVLAVGLSVGFYLWRQAQAGLDQIELELSEAVVVEEVMWSREMAVQVPSTTIENFDLMDNQAVVTLSGVSPKRPLPYREIRFYRQVGMNWLPTLPDDAFWGQEESLESKYFVFQFRHRDREVVTAAASSLDDQYIRMRQTLGLPLPAEDQTAKEKIQVDVLPESDPLARLAGDQTVLQLPSPTLISAPESVTEAQVLAEGAMHRLSAEAIWVAADNQYGDMAFVPSYVYHGALNWLSWDRKNPLSEYRKELIPWIYSELPMGPTQLPDHFNEMCQLMDVWQRPTWDLGVYLPCKLAAPVMSPDLLPATQFSELPIPMKDREWVKAVRGQSLAVATVFDYVVHDFGPEEIPSLLAAIGHGETWQKITTEQFGMSEEAFEAGWHAFMMAEYGVDLRSDPAPERVYLLKSQ